MIQRLIYTICALLFLYSYSFAGVHVKNKSQIFIKSQKMIKKMSFYAKPFRAPDQEPLERFCKLPSQSAQNYLDNKMQAAQSNNIAAYQYGMLIGFAPCLEHKPKQSLRHLISASRNGITNASYLVGILLLNENDLESAQNYFFQGVKSLHSKSAYNYAILQSNGFKSLDKGTLKSLKIAATGGQDFIKHDAIIAELQLKLQNKTLLKNANIVHATDRLNEISKQSANDNLKLIIKDNINLLDQFKNTLTVHQNKTHENIQINHKLFASLIDQSIHFFDQEVHLR